MRMPSAISIFVVWLLIFVAAVPLLARADEPPARPVKLIFDTDMGNDIDDALAARRHSRTAKPR